MHHLLSLDRRRNIPNPRRAKLEIGPGQIYTSKGKHSQEPPLLKRLGLGWYFKGRDCFYGHIVDYLSAVGRLCFWSKCSCCLVPFSVSVSGEFLSVLSRRSCRDLHAWAALNQFFLLEEHKCIKQLAASHWRNTQMSPFGIQTHGCYAVSKPSSGFHLRFSFSFSFFLTNIEIHKTPTDVQTFECLHKVCQLTITPSVVAECRPSSKDEGCSLQILHTGVCVKLFCNVYPPRRCPRRRAKEFPSPATFTATRGTGQTRLSSPRPSSPLSVSDGHVTSQVTEFGLRKESSWSWKHMLIIFRYRVQLLSVSFFFWINI